MKLSKKSIMTFGLVLASSLTGCGKLPEISLPDNPLDSLKGSSWVSPCVQDPTSLRYFTETFSLSDSLSVSRSRNYFSDSGCSAPSYSVQEAGTASAAGLPSIELEVEVEHEHEIESELEDQCEPGDSMPPSVAELMGAPGEEEFGECDDHGRWKIKIKETHLEKRVFSVEAGLTALNLLLNSTKIVVHSESEALDFSTRLVCGRAEWHVGEEVSLSADCEDSEKEIHHKSSGKKGYDVYKKEGDSMYFGDDSLSSESPEIKRSDRRKKGKDQVENDRPSSIERTRPFSKVEKTS